MHFSSDSDSSSFDVWPGFVDALSSLLLVVIFVVLGFFVSQVYLSDALNNSDSSVHALQQSLAQLHAQLGNSEHQRDFAVQKNRSLEAELLKIQGLLTAMRLQGEKVKTDRDQLQAKAAALDTALQQQQAHLTTVKQTLEEALAAKVEELRKLREELSVLNAQIPPEVRQNPEVLKYRSEFFGALQAVLGKRQDVKIVGDRFVFQSEVFFSQGSDELGVQGRQALDQLAKALQEIRARVPQTLRWVLRVDGHTDSVPIHNERFASNWELSLARAAAVVKYLHSKGIPASNLMAAGFSSYHPLTTDQKQLAKNRRIEFRFDQL